MKKLMTMVAAVATSLGLFAAVEFQTSVNSDLSAREAGDTNIVGVDDDGQGTSNIHWWDDAYKATGYESPAVVSNDTEGVGKYLAVETDASPLLRTFGKVTVGQETAQYDAVNIADHGLFIQTKVCLTAFEDDSVEQKLDGNKLLVWLKATEGEGNVEGVTNLMVTCGSWSEGSMTPVSYALDNVDVEPGQWVTLTIRADKDTTDNVPKFKVFVDGVQATAEAGAVDEFPSLIGGAANLTLKAAGFDGTGSVNFVNLLTPADAPAFAADPTEVAITWGDHVTSVTIAGAEVDPTVPYLVTKFGEDITATITYEDGYRRASVKPTGFADGCFTEDIANNQFTFSVARYANASVAIEAELDRNEAGLVINGETVGTFSSLAAAFAKIKELCPTYVAGDTAVIKMNEDASADDFGFDDEINPDVTIDLNGHTIECTNENTDFYAFEAYGALKIIDSSDLGGGKIIGNIYADYSLDILEAAKDIVIDGNIDYCTEEELQATVIIERAKVTDPIPAGEFVQLGKEGEDMEWAGPDEDGFYTLVNKAVKGTVLLISGTTTNDYQTLALALAAAQSGDIVMPTATIAELQTTITVKAGVTLDLNNQIVNVDFHQTKLSNAGKIVIYNNSLALVNNWYIGGNFEAGEELTDDSNFVFPKGTQMDVAKQTAVQTAITITGDIQWGLPIESNKLVTVVGTAAINAKIYPTATLTVPNAITPTLTTIEGFEVKSTVGETTTTWAAEEKQGGWDVPSGDEDKPASQVWETIPSNLADVPAGKLSTWAKKNEVPFGGEFTETMSDAYLLDCAPTAEKVAEEKAKINIASIEFVNNEWVIKTVSEDEAGDEFGNGKLQLVDVTEAITGAEGSDATKLWKMKLVPITAK